MIYWEGFYARKYMWTVHSFLHLNILIFEPRLIVQWVFKIAFSRSQPQTDGSIECSWWINFEIVLTCISLFKTLFPTSNSALTCEQRSLISPRRTRSARRVIQLILFMYVNISFAEFLMYCQYIALLSTYLTFIVLKVKLHYSLIIFSSDSLFCYQTLQKQTVPFLVSALLKYILKFWHFWVSTSFALFF